VRTYQSALAAALLDPEAPTPGAIRSPSGTSRDCRFAVHRNNVAAGLIGALEERFPTVLRLVGPAFFRGMARRYAELEPPRSPILLRYGDTFPRFIENFPPAASVPYLADVARLEFARGVAYHAADAPPLAPCAFADLDEQALAATTARLHPSVTLMSSRFPIVSIWEAHQRKPEPALTTWNAEAALIARPHLDVEVRTLPPGGYAFLRELVQGSTLLTALATAAEEAPAFDPAANLAVLIGSRISIRLVTLKVREGR
jgi:hypothetical protein